ncbi:hypothetical protein EVAR_9647_1 [Eumeta japonica]|uniref:Uncharacterized protein n=1 Tax=Eumeta variegata TaxID=151549 RepID=A0A4C1TKM4_EUMVA|nr:hypothetical protein EVAR_9647_1 [Eumeta japonica]
MIKGGRERERVRGQEGGVRERNKTAPLFLTSRGRCYSTIMCCARGRPIIVEWERRKAFGGPLSFGDSSLRYRALHFFKRFGQKCVKCVPQQRRPVSFRATIKVVVYKSHGGAAAGGMDPLSFASSNVPLSARRSPRAGLYTLRLSNTTCPQHDYATPARARSPARRPTPRFPTCVVHPAEFDVDVREIFTSALEDYSQTSPTRFLGFPRNRSRERPYRRSCTSAALVFPTRIRNTYQGLDRCIIGFRIFYCGAFIDLR